MKTGCFKPALAAMLTGALLFGALPAQSQQAFSAAKAKSKKSGTKVKFLPGSEETVNQRRARLQREC